MRENQNTFNVRIRNNNNNSIIWNRHAKRCKNSTMNDNNNNYKMLFVSFDRLIRGICLSLLLENAHDSGGIWQICMFCMANEMQNVRAHIAQTKGIERPVRTKIVKENAIKYCQFSLWMNPFKLNCLYVCVCVSVIGIRLAARSTHIVRICTNGRESWVNRLCLFLIHAIRFSCAALSLSLEHHYYYYYRQFTYLCRLEFRFGFIFGNFSTCSRINIIYQISCTLLYRCRSDTSLAKCIRAMITIACVF